MLTVELLLSIMKNNGDIPPFEPPAFTKLALLCRGVAVRPHSIALRSSEFDEERTGSFVSIILGGGIPVRAPADPVPSRSADFRLVETGESAELFDGEKTVPGAEILPVPGWESQKTTAGSRMGGIAELDGTVLRLGKESSCYLEGDERCGFCTKQNIRRNYAYSCLTETASTACRESNVRSLELDPGCVENGFIRDLVEATVSGLLDLTQLPVGIRLQVPPDIELLKLIRRSGVKRLTLAMPLFGRESRKRYTPGKAARFDRDEYLEALALAAPLFENVFCEISAGLEPLEDTKNAISRISGSGAVPSLTVFFPEPGTPLETFPAPARLSLLPLCRGLAESTFQQRSPTDSVKGILKGSALLPEECLSTRRRRIAAPFRKIGRWLGAGKSEKRK